MDSFDIAQFLESTYTDQPVRLTSDLGSEVRSQTRALFAPAFRISVSPREAKILLPRSEEYFRRRLEATLGHRLEDLLNPEKEEQAWNEVSKGMQTIDEMVQTQRAAGPFLLGAQPSFTDFTLAGSMQCARTVDEGVFQRIIKYPFLKEIYDGCLPYMDKKD
jgi:glutathione S-transferase